MVLFCLKTPWPDACKQANIKATAISSVLLIGRV